MTEKNNRLVIGTHIFNGLSAVTGGMALMSGTIKHAEWIRHTAFTSLYFPGVILFAIVGGSSLLAAISLYKRTTGCNLASLLAGLIMIFWIIGEIISIRGIHFLQAIYLITGAFIIWLTAKEGGTP